MRTWDNIHLSGEPEQPPSVKELEHVSEEGKLPDRWRAEKKMPGKKKDVRRSYHCTFSSSRHGVTWCVAEIILVIRQTEGESVCHFTLRGSVSSVFQGKGGPRDWDSSLPRRHCAGTEHAITLRGAWLRSPFDRWRERGSASWRDLWLQGFIRH